MVSLVDSMEMSVTRVFVGSLMTSLEMAGVSLTLLKVLPGWEQLLGEVEPVTIITKPMVCAYVK